MGRSDIGGDSGRGKERKGDEREGGKREETRTGGKQEQEGGKRGTVRVKMGDMLGKEEGKA